MIFKDQILKYNPNPSKSYSHRYLILCSFIDDVFEIENINLNNDILETINVLVKLGKDINIIDNKIIVKGSRSFDFTNEVSINESGTTLRLLLPLLSYIGVKRIKVKDRLFERPIEEYNALIEKKENNYIYLKRGEISEVNGSISSQFISGLLIFNALTGNKKPLVIKNKIVSKKYIEITFDVLNKLGFVFDGYTYVGKQEHINKIYVEDDYSSAANYIVYGLLHDGINLRNLNLESLQGDRKILNMFGDDITLNNDLIIVHKGKLRPIFVDLDETIDLGPILFVYALFAKGESRFINYDRLKDKESDRLNSMLQLFDKLGVKYRFADGSFYIEGKDNYPFVEAKSYNDHRIAMSLIVFGLTNPNGVDIDDISCIKKSVLKFI